MSKKELVNEPSLFDRDEEKGERQIRAAVLTEKQYIKYLALDEYHRQLYIDKLAKENPVNIKPIEEENKDKTEEYDEVDGERRTKTIYDEETGLETYDIVNKENKNNKDAVVHAIVVDNYYIDLGVSLKYPPKDPKNPTKEEIFKAITGDESGRLLIIEDSKRGVQTVALQDENYNTVMTNYYSEKLQKGLSVIGNFQISYDFNVSKKYARKYMEDLMKEQEQNQDQETDKDESEEKKVHPAERLASENFELFYDSEKQEARQQSVGMKM